MTFHGLFVGIDRYESPDIRWLNCARRDAVALHALFTDTLGGNTTLLLDAEATRSVIEEQFKRFATCNVEDVVVITFSGHGSETHELVTYDADPQDLSITSIPLETLTQWFADIPARHLVCILDCCFSGGMGAKVLHVASLPRSLASAESLLEQLSGEGRLILTASKATEEAWENPRSGHGLLTYYLLEALQGAEEIRQSGKISIYRLLEYVTQRVTDAASQLGKPQHPTLRGLIDGALTWPIFTPGKVYQMAFPERTRPHITADIQSLTAYGFPAALLSAWARVIPSLNALQLDAINEFGLLEGEHLIISAPPSSGKTLIGELAAVKGALERKRALFLLPLKSLVNDKHQYFTDTYSAFGLRIIRATGAIADDVPAFMRGQYDICLMTYEKFAALALGSPHVLDQVGTIVVDEVQMIADSSRGANLEFLLTLLRMRRRRDVEPQLIALSAVVGDTNGLERWLGARLLLRHERPVPLDEGVLFRDGRFRYLDPTGEERITAPLIHPVWRKGSSQDLIIPLVQKLVADGKQVIVFRETKSEARGCALYLARELGLPPVQAALDALPTGDPSFASTKLREALQHGVAFHHADLDRDERLVIEEQFRTPGTLLRVLAATTTLAMGVNTPAEAVIIAGLEHPGQQPYSVAEYKNMVGRAGRLGFAARGTSYLLALDPHQEHHLWEYYVTGVPEDLQSRFIASDTDPRSLILRVLVAAHRFAHQGISTDDIVDFLESSFGAFQAIQSAQSWRWDRKLLERALDELLGHNLIESTNEGRYQLTELGWLAGQGGIEVESIIRIVEVLASLEPNMINDPTLIATTQLTVELDAVLFPINKKSTQKEPQAWTSELRRQNIPATVLNALRRRVTDQHQGTLRAKKTVACLLWITDIPMTDIERVLTQFGGSLDGAAGPIRATSARTCDVLPTVLRVAEVLHPDLDLAERGERLFTRLEVGVPAGVVDLAMQVGSYLTRADYQRLLQAGLCTIEAIEGSSNEALLACLEGNKEKLTIVRDAVPAYYERKNNRVTALPMLPLYQM